METLATPQSSNLKSASYDELKKELIIEFKNGGKYKYYKVPSQVFEGLKQAESKGQYFMKFIRNAGYIYKKV